MLSEKARRYLGDNPAISQEDFEPFWLLNPQGDPQEAYINVAYAIANKKTFHGHPLSLSFLIEKYKEHIQNASAPKYVARISNWVSKEKYNEEHGRPDHPAFNDLLGGAT